MSIQIRRFSLRLLLCLSLFPLSAFAEKLSLEVRADREDCRYSLGDSVTFTIDCRNPGKIKQAALQYRLSEDGERVIAEGPLNFSGGSCSLKGALDRPGFLRLDLTLIADGDTTRAACGCAFSPESIRPTNVLPEDFDSFWRQARAELLRVPPDPRVEEAPDTAARGSRRYKVSLANIENSRIYGWLTVPDGAGPFPAVLCVPGAGVNDVGAHANYARAGMVVLSLEIHGIGVGLEDSYYAGLRDGLLYNYRFFGCTDPYHFYYRRVILGAVRALDYLAGREDVDSTRLGIAGSSQGGALSLLVSGIDKRIKALTANVPAMCDHTGQLQRRPSGWPRLLRHDNSPAALRTCGYYDAALNAGLITVPALLAVGCVDNTCAPTTVYAAYNNLRGPKEIDGFPKMGHSYGPGWEEKAVKWLKDKLDHAGK